MSHHLKLRSDYCARNTKQINSDISYSLLSYWEVLGASIVLVRTGCSAVQFQSLDVVELLWSIVFPFSTLSF